MKVENLLQHYAKDSRIQEFVSCFGSKATCRYLGLHGLKGSSRALVCTVLARQITYPHLFILKDKESAAYFCNDLENLLGETNLEQASKRVLFYPASYKRPYQIEETDNANVLSRIEVLNRLSNVEDSLWIVTYPEALAEKVIASKQLQRNRVDIHQSEPLSIDFLIDFLDEYDFERVDFVAQPGQYAIRGGIVDVFSYSNDQPYRIELDDETVVSMRTFDVGTQLSIQKYDRISILPDVRKKTEVEEYVDFVSYLSAYSTVWIEEVRSLVSSLDASYAEAADLYEKMDSPLMHRHVSELYTKSVDLLNSLQKRTVVEMGETAFFKHHASLTFNTRPQPIFNKNLEMLAEYLLDMKDRGYQRLILSDNAKQIQRLERVFFELSTADRPLDFDSLSLSLHEGFVDEDLKLCVFTDHQIFQRYHRYNVQSRRDDSKVLTLKELYNLKPGDYVTHIDYGVGCFAGLEKVEVNGKAQEAICIVYKGNDTLKMSIHSLHKISRYSGQDGVVPTMHRLGSNAWEKVKNKTKQRVKDIAQDLINLYAKRKSSKGFAFSADSYLQHELESSFFYEDTPDQLKATQEVKRDMEAVEPMDRLVCGDVGFGKTEVAIRAAFKAVCDNKQVAVLVPTTILAYQHYKTFVERLEHLPCKVDYLNRFRTAKEKKRILQDLSDGKIDILIGTHSIVGKDVHFKDLGLLIIDEEQKFGVAVKEKLKKLKVNVDTLTLTATPIPRTLQFSLMGARDLSVINTPPPNRYPVQTEIHPFSEEFIRDAILQELSRGGQVYFVHHRVQNILEIAGMIQRLIPDAKIGVAHGQMEGDALENVLLGFMEGEFDILVATKIVENGLDIANANTMIVNEAAHYGLNELHQLRGRVGRSNKKAYCYLIAPPDHLLTPEAKKRLKAIEEFSDVGSGFQIAMRDLDIRGAGNILGGEQSGFISEIGFEMYQRILDEALQELRESLLNGEIKDAETQEVIKAEDTTLKQWKVLDCQIDTDLEILIPDTYVSNITERLALYKELNALKTGAELEAFSQRLEDRFGKIPPPAQALIQTIALRQQAMEVGFSRLRLKQGKLVATFAFQDEEYFQSAYFTRILSYVQNHPAQCNFRDEQSKLSVVFNDIPDIPSASRLLKEILEEE